MLHEVLADEVQVALHITEALVAHQPRRIGVGNPPTSKIRQFALHTTLKPSLFI